MLTDCEILKACWRQLQNFCHWATCPILRIQNEENLCRLLIQVKKEVASLKHVTVPWLEFLACLICAKLAGTIVREMKIYTLKTIYWTDAKNALNWMKKDDGCPTVMSK